MKNYEIAIIGAGNGGRAFAVYLAVKHRKVNLVYRTQQNHTKISYSLDIQAEGEYNATSGCIWLRVVIIKLLRNARIILFVVPASAHLEIIRQIIPFLRKNQIILLNPGPTWGAIEVYNEIQCDRPGLQVFVGETQSLLFTSRRIGDFGVNIFSIKNQVDYCFYPEADTYKVQHFIESEFPQLHAVYDIRETSLNNIGAILHPTIAILNAGPLGRSDPFLFYRQGVTPEIAQTIEDLDRERMNILRKMGIRPTSFLEWVQTVYECDAKDYYEAFQRIQSYGEIPAPDQLDVRYLTEDIPTGLVPLASLWPIFWSENPDHACINCPGESFVRY